MNNEHFFSCLANQSFCATKQQLTPSAKCSEIYDLELFNFIPPEFLVKENDPGQVLSALEFLILTPLLISQTIHF